ncbi:MAG TPA: rubrerythrin family protein [Calditrichia bacterium]|nr:rubrerythrin family protein [Calditrichota bacterium]HQU74879.1 rubrerythrin family protein [Calditrichia bacterium]HQV30499.1 rubrerythrin family protein [Calditrichia bacterium]
MSYLPQFLKRAILILFGVPGMFSVLFAQTPTTIENLKSALLGETTASAKYAAFAQRAKEEGLPSIAVLFEAASRSEEIHANNHLAALRQLGVSATVSPEPFEVQTTRENLRAAIDGESYEVSEMYPRFLRTADAEQINIAKLSFNYAYQTEKKHQALYANALRLLDEQRQSALPARYQVCSTCGNTYELEAPGRCGISMTPKERFITVSVD